MQPTDVWFPAYPSKSDLGSAKAPPPPCIAGNGRFALCSSRQSFVGADEFSHCRCSLAVEGAHPPPKELARAAGSARPSALLGAGGAHPWSACWRLIRLSWSSNLCREKRFGCVGVRFACAWPRFGAQQGWRRLRGRRTGSSSWKIDLAELSKHGQGRNPLPLLSFFFSTKWA